MFSFFRRKRRQTPRKVIRASGNVLINGHEFEFSTEDLSTEGAQLRVMGKVEAPTGLEIELSIDEIDVAARARVCWARPEGDELTQIGLKFSDLEGIAGVERLQHEA
ncbi:MAG: PilZ domain-containing protein [Granulosicoccaceae bacterium]